MTRRLSSLGHRSQRLRRLSCLRDQLQGMEHFRFRRAVVRRESLRRRSDRHVLQPRADVRGRAISQYRNGAFPEILPALRGSAVRAGVSDRRFLQAQAGRHRAGGLRQMHRLQILLLGLSLRRARNRRKAEGDEEMHLVRGSHLRHDAAGNRPQTFLRQGLPDQRAPVRRYPRSRIGGVEGDTRKCRLCI